MLMVDQVFVYPHQYPLDRACPYQVQYPWVTPTHQELRPFHWIPTNQKKRNHQIATRRYHQKPPNCARHVTVAIDPRFAALEAYRAAVAGSLQQIAFIAHPPELASRKDAAVVRPSSARREQLPSMPPSLRSLLQQNTLAQMAYHYRKDLPASPAIPAPGPTPYRSVPWMQTRRPRAAAVTCRACLGLPTITAKK
jgi:hypothetical protein